MPPETSRLSYFDPLVLAKIANMSLRARHVVEGLLSGLHDSPYRGYSVEFAEHREYVPATKFVILTGKLTASSTAISSKSTKTRPICAPTSWSTAAGR